MNKIPVSFQIEGKQYLGTLEPVHGAGVNVWHLMVDKYYWGRLRLVNGVWFFDENKQRAAHLADYFGDVVMAAGG